jgi:endonuclease-8
VPEGDAVWRTARHLDQALSGAVLRESDVRVPSYAGVDLSGEKVLETLSLGKHLLTRIGPATTLHTHLKMEGAWHLYRPGTAWRRPAHQARIVLRTDEWTAVGFSLGVVEVLDRHAEDSAVGHLGPDLLGPDWDEDEAVRLLLEKPDRPVGEALLDQRNLAGLGTIYRAEVCFVAGVSPWAPVTRVEHLARMVRRAKALLEANKERGRPATTGDLRTGRELWVYRRDGQPCRRCGTPVRVAMQGPVGLGAGAERASAQASRERATYWCPRCQPAPDPVDGDRV